MRVGISWNDWNTKPTFSLRSRARWSSVSAPRSFPSSSTRARRGTVEPGEQAQQRGLAAARGAHDGQEPAALEGEGDIVQDGERTPAGEVGLGQRLGSAACRETPRETASG